MADKDSNGTDDHDIEEEGADRHFYVKVDRSEETPVVDYFRLGSASDDASYDSDTSVEKQTRISITKDQALGGISNKIGDSGVLFYTSGDRSEFIGDDSFERVMGEAYKIYGEKHEIIDAANVVSGAAKGLVRDIGLEYSVSNALEYSAAAAAKLEFAAGVFYGSRLSAGIESKTGVGLGISLGGEIEVAHSVKAEFNAKGEFEAPSSGLNHGETPVYFGEESITLGLDHDPIHGTIKTVLQTLAVLLQTGDLAYTANGIAATARISDFKKNHDDVETHVNIAQGIAMTQGVLGLIACVACGMAGNILKTKAKALAANIDGKPYIRIDKPAGGATNDIKLDTGGGASITLSGDEVTIRARTINLHTNAPGSEGPISIAAGTTLDLYGTDGMLLNSPELIGVHSPQGIDLNAGVANITSNANTWTHNGQFAAGATTLGATTATSLNATGAPVAATPTSVVVQAQVDTLQSRINMVAATAVVGLGAALASLLG